MLAFILSLGVMAQDRVITGSVKDKNDGSTIPGASIVVKGTTIGTTTTIDGTYSLKVPPKATLLEFTFVGYKKQEINIGNQAKIDVLLETDVIGLEELVIVGYGSTKKMDLTGSVTTIKSDKLSNQPAANIGQVLQGKVAGVQVTNNGAPGAAPTIRIRGLGTVNSSADPLYVVDGVLTSDISFLSPSDIESTTVLKDASASAIYGVKASNGVLIINTRRSTGRDAKVTYSGYTGMQTAVNQLPMANNTQYIELINEKGLYQAQAAGTTYDPRNPADFPVYTNWYDQVLNSQAKIMSHDLGFSGGSGKNLYYFGVGYFKQEGLINGQNYERLNLRSSMDMDASKYIKVGYTATLSGFRTNDAPSVFYDAYITPPVFEPMLNDTAYTDPVGLGLGNFANPSASLNYFNSQSNGIRLVGSVYAEISFLKYFQFRSQYGADFGYARNRSYTPWYYVSVNQKDTNQTLSRTINYDYKSTWDNTMTFDYHTGDHRIKAMAGMSSQYESTLGLFGSRLGVVDFGNQSLYLGLGREKTAVANDWGSKITALSYFGRVNYSFKDRYLMTATLRRDGSSVFPASDRWDMFPSVGLGWIITGEEFMKNQKIFDFLKLRASWGTNGNNRIPANVYTLVVSQGGELSTTFNQGGVMVIAEGANITSAVPSQLKWERLNEIDIAIEGKSFNDKLSYEIDFYSRTTQDAIFPLTLSATAGTSGSYLTNNADILNRGVEFTLGYNSKIGKVSYDLNFNYAYNHNEVSKLRPGTIGIYGGGLNNGGFFTTYTVVGQPIGSYYGRNVIGIFQNQAEVDSYTNSKGEKIQPTAKPGDFKFEDIDGNGIIDAKDRIFMGSAIPTSSMGFSASVLYAGFDLTVDVYARWGNKIYNAKRDQRLGNENYDLDFYNNRWHGEGTSTTYPSADLTSENGNKAPNTWYVEDGAFLRVRTIQLGYTLPERFTKKIGLEKVRLYTNASNPINLFGYNGFNPEISGGSSTSQGIDLNVYPMSATYNFGINLSF